MGPQLSLMDVNYSEEARAPSRWRLGIYRINHKSTSTVLMLTGSYLCWQCCSVCRDFEFQERSGEDQSATWEGADISAETAEGRARSHASIRSTLSTSPSRILSLTRRVSDALRTRAAMNSSVDLHRTPRSPDTTINAFETQQSTARGARKYTPQVRNVHLHSQQITCRPDFVRAPDLCMFLIGTNTPRTWRLNIAGKIIAGKMVVNEDGMSYARCDLGLSVRFRSSSIPACPLSIIMFAGSLRLPDCYSVVIIVAV